MFMMMFSAMSLAACSFLIYVFLQLYWPFVVERKHRTGIYDRVKRIQA